MSRSPKHKNLAIGTRNKKPKKKDLNINRTTRRGRNRTRSRGRAPYIPNRYKVANIAELCDSNRTFRTIPICQVGWFTSRVNLNKRRRNLSWPPLLRNRGIVRGATNPVNLKWNEYGREANNGRFHLFTANCNETNDGQFWEQSKTNKRTRKQNPNRNKFDGGRSLLTRSYYANYTRKGHLTESIHNNNYNYSILCYKTRYFDQ